MILSVELIANISGVIIKAIIAEFTLHFLHKNLFTVDYIDQSFVNISFLFTFDR